MSTASLTSSLWARLVAYMFFIIVTQGVVGTQSICS